MRHASTFKFKLLTLFFTSILIPLVAMSFLLLFFFNNRNKQISEQNIQNILYTVSGNMYIYLEDLKRISMSPNIYPDVMQYYELLNKSDENSDSNSFEQYLIEKKYRVFMQQLLTISRSDIKGVAFIPQNNPNNIIYTIDAYNGTVASKSNYLYKEESWYEDVLVKMGMPVLSLSETVDYYDNPPYLTTPRSGDAPSIFSVTRLITDNNLQENVGIIKVDASSAVIRDIFNNIATSKHSALLLLDQNNDVIYSTRDGLGVLMKTLDTNSAKVSWESDTFYSYNRSIDDSAWRLIYLSSRNDINSQNITIFYITAMLSIVCFAVGLAIFLFNSNKITAQVHNIIRTMKQVEQGDLTAQVNLNCNVNADFSLISHELNSMVTKLNTHINNEYKAVISQRNAEYRALQAQINPHFLYNTLNGFITLNRIGAKQTLEDSILRLTTLFRYTCNDENSSTVENELDFIEQYLLLQKLRFDDRLEFSVSMEDDVKQCTIPKLIIQPIVENAIIHGMESSDKIIFIEVYACFFNSELSGRSLLISVMDNGAGFNQDNLNNSAHVGLKNTAERLALFSKNSQFVIKSAPEEGTTCHIIIPVDRGMET